MQTKDKPIEKLYENLLKAGKIFSIVIEGSIFSMKK